MNSTVTNTQLFIMDNMCILFVNKKKKNGGKFKQKKMRCFPSTDFIAIQKAKQEKKILDLFIYSF